jgi:hypothetical protein
MYCREKFSQRECVGKILKITAPSVDEMQAHPCKNVFNFCFHARMVIKKVGHAYTQKRIK